MTEYVATVSVPGYLPTAEPAVFDTPQEAWAFLASERGRDEDAMEPDAVTYSSAREKLALSADWRLGDEPHKWLAPDGTGVVFGDTPGYGGDYDLGLAYVVEID